MCCYLRIITAAAVVSTHVNSDTASLFYLDPLVRAIPDVPCEMALVIAPVLAVRAREGFFARVFTEVPSELAFIISPVLALVALEPPCLPRGRDDLPLLRVLAADVIGEMALPLRPVIAVGARKGVLVRGPLPLGHDDDVTTHQTAFRNGI